MLPSDQGGVLGSVPAVPRAALGCVPHPVGHPVVAERCGDTDKSVIWGGRLNMMAVANDVAVALLRLCDGVELAELARMVDDALELGREVAEFVTTRAIAQFHSAGFLDGTQPAFEFLDSIGWDHTVALPIRLLKRRGITVGSMLGFPRVEIDYEPGSCIEKRLELAAVDHLVGVRVGDQAFSIRCVDGDHARWLSEALGELSAGVGAGFAPALHLVGAGSGSEARSRHRLYDSVGGLLVLSKDFGRIAEAIGGYVGAAALYRSESVLVLANRSLIGPEGAVLVGPPTFRRLATIERRLNRSGWYLVDQGRALLDVRTGEVIVAPPVDLGVDRELVTRGAAPGRYQLVGMVSDGSAREADSLTVFVQLVAAMPLDVDPDATLLRMLLDLADGCWGVRIAPDDTAGRLHDVLTGTASEAPN